MARSLHFLDTFAAGFDFFMPGHRTLNHYNCAQGKFKRFRSVANRVSGCWCKGQRATGAGPVGFSRTSFGATGDRLRRNGEWFMELLAIALMFAFFGLSLGMVTVYSMLMGERP